MVIAVPSFALLYSIDEVVDPALTVKIVGHQWYWTYEYPDHEFAFDSYMIGADADYTFDTPAGSLRLFVHARNLLDESARRHTSFIKDFAPMPGASVMAGVEWRLL